MARHHLERRVANENEQKRLAQQKPLAWLLVASGGALFICNYLGIIGTLNLATETICMIAVLLGGFWLWHLRPEAERSSRRNMEDAKERNRLGGDY